jgi:hypothetical protein
MLTCSVHELKLRNFIRSSWTSTVRKLLMKFRGFNSSTEQDRRPTRLLSPTKHIHRCGLPTC